MIKRELYMRRIRPFIGGDLIKVMTGIRRSGKLQFTELSGRCSVFERPLSDAKRPLFF